MLLGTGPYRFFPTSPNVKGVIVENLTPEEFAQLPAADQAQHYQELCRELHAAKTARDQTQRELAESRAARESDKIDAHLADVGREKGVYHVGQFITQVRARNPRFDEKDRVIVDGDSGEPLTVPQLADQWHRSTSVMANQFKDVVESWKQGPPPPLNKEGTAIDAVQLARQSTADYIRVRQEKGPAALGLRPSKYGQGR